MLEAFGAGGTGGRLQKTAAGVVGGLRLEARLSLPSQTAAIRGLLVVLDQLARGVGAAQPACAAAHVTPDDHEHRDRHLKGRTEPVGSHGSAVGASTQVRWNVTAPERE